jgi:hypothetical protein
MPITVPQRGLITPPIAPISGRYYSHRSAYYTTTTTLPMTANVFYAAPFFVTAPMTADRIALNITVAAAGGKLLRIGIYAATAAGLPGALLVDSGALAADAIATVQATISQALVPGTLYYLAAVTDGTPSVTGSSAFFSPYGGLDATDVTRQTLSRSFTFAALPNPWGTANIWGAVAPHVALRAV